MRLLTFFLGPSSNYIINKMNILEAQNIVLVFYYLVDVLLPLCRTLDFARHFVRRYSLEKPFPSSIFSLRASAGTKSNGPFTLSPPHPHRFANQ